MVHKLVQSIPIIAMALAALTCTAIPGAPLLLTPVPTPTSGPFNAARGTHSDNWSGYIVDPANFRSGVVTEVGGQWSVPVVTCGKVDTASAIWIGIDGVTDPTVEQTGTSQECVSGQAVYCAWVELFPRPLRDVVNFSVAPGNVIQATIVYDVRQGFTLSLKNLSTGQDFSVSRSVSRARRRSVEWIVEAPATTDGSILRLANSGRMQFTNASAILNGHKGAINDGTWQYGAEIMADQDGTIKAQPSTLSSDGSNFSVIWRSE
ncbi:MAG TPA: G1 family glutamic endopeptidase [Aggregatilineales bacterium]|nr:G1 family glutamic endopeptidase [Aggregatilineales bacterium]